MKIKGIPVGTNMPRSDWTQEDPRKADFIKNKPTDLLHGTDTSLSVSGKAADAAATGDALQNIRNEVVEVYGTDTSLSVSGKAADAAATGDALQNIRNEVVEVYGTDTSLSVSGKAADAAATGEALAGKAPAGYGLGESNGKTCADCNTAVINGWYVTSATAKNCPVVGSTDLAQSMLFVQARGVKIYQCYWACTAGYYGMLQRYSIDTGATWTMWEWINPPMYEGVEYRTTERYQGKPVYVKVIPLGTMPNATYKSVSHGIPDIYAVVGISGIAIEEGTGYSVFLPSSNGTVAMNWNIGANTSTIIVVTNGDRTAYTGWATIKYTKTTD